MSTSYKMAVLQVNAFFKKAAPAPAKKAAANSDDEFGSDAESDVEAIADVAPRAASSRRGGAARKVYKEESSDEESDEDDFEDDGDDSDFE